MSSFKLSPMVISTMFVFVALMSMQLIVTSTVEGATHTTENHRKFTKNRFLVSNSMVGGSRRQLLVLCPPTPCMGGQTCCPDLFGPLFNVCISDLGPTNIGSCIECNDPCPVGAICCSVPLYSICIGLEDINNCGACNNKCSVGQQCCSGQCVNTLTNSTNCGECGHVCNNVPCTLGICGGYGN